MDELDEKQMEEITQNLHGAFSYAFPHDTENNYGHTVEPIKNSMKMSSKSMIKNYKENELTKRGDQKAWVTPMDNILEFIRDGLVGKTYPKTTDYGDYEYFFQYGIHDRLHPFKSKFTGKVLVVKIHLGVEFTATVLTPFGNVVKSDHWFFNVKKINKAYADQVGFHCQKADLITPLRYEGARFAPAAVYLCYRNRSDEEPSYWITEAGTALGTEATLFMGYPMDVKLVQKTGYKPTPWASVDNMFHSTLKTRGQDVSKIVIESHLPDSPKPYIRVTIKYQKIKGFKSLDLVTPPILLQEKALCRIMAITDGLNDLVLPTDKILAQKGRTKYAWIHPPPDGKTSNPENPKKNRRKHRHSHDSEDSNDKPKKRRKGSSDRCSRDSSDDSVEAPTKHRKNSAPVDDSDEDIALKTSKRRKNSAPSDTVHGNERRKHHKKRKSSDSNDSSDEGRRKRHKHKHRRADTMTQKPDDCESGDDFSDDLSEGNNGSGCSVM